MSGGSRSRLRAVVVLLAGAFACGGAPHPGAADAHEAHGEHDGEHVGEDEHAGEEVVTLSPHVIATNGITTASADRRLLLGALEVPAAVQIDPDRTAHVASTVPGRIEEVRAVLGQRVERGETLALVRSAEVGVARGDLAAARARQKAASAEVDRLRPLVNEGIAAKRTLVEAEARLAEAEADATGVRASLRAFGTRDSGATGLPLVSPLAGTIIERHASPGEVVDASASRFVVADLSQVWVIGRVYEQELARVSAGMPAEVALIAYPGRTWRGVVDYVSSTLDEDTRTMSIRVVLDNAEGVIRPGMFGTIALATTSEEERVLSVPTSAVQSLGERTVVFVAGDEAGSFRARDVATGNQAHGLTEILTGLEDGEPVVVEGAFILKSELLAASLGEGHAH